MRRLASAFGPVPGAERCRSDGIGKAVLGPGLAVGLEERGLRVLGRVVCLGHRREEDRGRCRDEVRVVVNGVDRRLVLGERRGTTAGRGSAPGAVADRVRARGGRGSRPCFTAWPERRTIAPSEAPVRKSTPTSVSRTPRISAPVVPTPSATSALELAADPAAVRGAEREHQPDDGDAQPELERADGHERAPGHHQPAERDQDDRGDVGGPADHGGDGVRHRAAREPEPEHAREEDPDREQPEADELGVVVAARALAPALLDARRRLRPRPRGTGAAACLRHRGPLRPARQDLATSPC